MGSDQFAFVPPLTETLHEDSFMQTNRLSYGKILSNIKEFRFLKVIMHDMSVSASHCWVLHICGSCVCFTVPSTKSEILVHKRTIAFLWQVLASKSQICPELSNGVCLLIFGVRKWRKTSDWKTVWYLPLRWSFSFYGWDRFLINLWIKLELIPTNDY